MFLRAVQVLGDELAVFTGAQCSEPADLMTSAGFVMSVGTPSNRSVPLTMPRTASTVLLSSAYCRSVVMAPPHSAFALDGVARRAGVDTYP